MERYILVAEFDDHHAANRACSILEARELPVMVDHGEQRTATGVEPLFRLMVPAHLSQTALQALSGFTVSQPSSFEPAADRPNLF